MSEYLPYGGFEWLKNVDGFHVISVSEKSQVGYFLEVELHMNYNMNNMNYTMIIH